VTKTDITDPINNIEINSDALIELSLLDNNKLKNIQIALITDNNDLKKLNYYLFRDVSDVDHYTIDSLDDIDITLLDSMDIIIFHKEDDALKHEILHNIKAKQLSTTFFCISSKPYLRQKDILEAHINGVDKLMKMDFFLEDYILSMEKYLHSNFYSKRLLKLEEPEDVLVSSQVKYSQRVNDLVERKIFFSSFCYKFKAEIDIDEYNLRKIVREYDTIFIDKNKNEITFLLLNVIPEFGEEVIKKRISNFSIILEHKTSISAFDLVFE